MDDRKTEFYLLMFCTLACVLSTYSLSYYIDYEVRKIQPKCGDCHNQLVEKWKLSRYYKRIGSPVPDQMAEATLQTKKPKLMAAIAKVETRGNPTKRNTGYKRRHSGAWQVSRYWGKVSHDITEQALQAELVLDTHIKAEGDLIDGLNAYGGDSKGKYARTVLAELERIR